MASETDVSKASVYPDITRNLRKAKYTRSLETNMDHYK
jgi:hypothetical protein